ncbi:MAG: C4-type zinc ribbon domain-containing protein [Demequinaceae bacterium]|nr:C4-type zinc ribbon domain-containing protein [Demequinaceae bacterium]
MPTVPAVDQQRLLDIQALDSEAQAATHRRASLPALASIVELGVRKKVLDDDLVTRTTEVSDLRREVTKAEDDVQSVRDRSERDATRLQSGQGTPKDLQALQSEIESLAKRQSDLEDIELDAMERLEAAEAGLAETKAEIDEAHSSFSSLATERDAAFSEIDGELARLASERAPLVEGLDQEIRALYEKIRASHEGVGAAALRAGQCSGCYVTIDPATLSSIATIPEDTILRCEECGRILIREA